MELQKRVLDEYLKISKNPTLKKIAEETGIQITRVFRLLNGSEMKLNEFLAINAVVEKKKGVEVPIGNLAMFCVSTLSEGALKEIQHDLERRIQLWELRRNV